jgi:hypothetical protein
VGLTYADAFENGAPGWIDATNGGAASAESIDGVGVVLGPLGGTGGTEAVQKTFTLTEDISHTTLQFDVLALDDLAGASGSIFIAGQEIGRVTKNGNETIFTAMDRPGVKVTAQTLFSGTNLGGKNEVGTEKDSLTRVQIIYEKPDPNFTFGFGSNGPEDSAVGSFSLDNFSITGLEDPDA